LYKGSNVQIGLNRTTRTHGIREISRTMGLDKIERHVVFDRNNKTDVVRQISTGQTELEKTKGIFGMMQEDPRGHTG
jgi:hypothetical protein